MPPLTPPVHARIQRLEDQMHLVTQANDAEHIKQARDIGTLQLMVAALGVGMFLLAVMLVVAVLS